MHKQIIFSILCLIPVIVPAQASYNRDRLQQFFQNQEYEQSLAYLKTVPAPDNEQYLFDLGYACYMNEDFKQARSVFTALYQKNGSLPAPQIYLASIHNMNREPDSALFYYKNLTRLFPEQYKYWQAAAAAWYLLKKNDSAIACIRKSYELKPTAGKVVYDYCTYLSGAKQKNQAEQLIDQFLRFDTTYAPIIGKKVNLSFTAGRYSEAVAWGERLRSRDVAPAELLSSYINLLFSYLNLKRPDSVISVYNWLLLQDANNESAAYGAALAFAMKKEYAVSDSLLTECIGFNIQEMAATYYRAKAGNAVAVQNYTRAVALYDTSYYLFKDLLDLYQAGSVLHRFLKNNTRATAYYKRFLQVCPHPKTDEEATITRYIKEFLSPQKK
ncbi:tetratricopeptide repeat protein [Niabella beijingensis]|uniref:tetratricopeptide repeat protein n=1 Tax=Niabella beijingensis TaxID=2872700 RepID=UPI001CBB6DE5|nr:hypothetical protein [Niabella beijingensis]MBZ4190223.1 hypothetical protein [Niabella beijingensis]